MAMGTCLPAKWRRRFGVAATIFLLASQGYAGAGGLSEGAARSVDKDAKQEAKARFVSGHTKPFVPGGSVGADQMCQADAVAANLANASQFLAFLATSTTPAMKRIRPSGAPWKRADDVFVVRQISDFANGNLGPRLGWSRTEVSTPTCRCGPAPAIRPCRAAAPARTGRQDWPPAAG